ncbi:MAG: hypothetical protein ACRC8S_02015 [Fimbriiglobus sp.]
MPPRKDPDSKRGHKRFRWSIAVGGALAVIVVGLCCGLGGGRWSTAPSPDLSQPGKIDLSDRSVNLIGTSGLSFHITGEINGVVEVWVDHWKPVRLTGKVDWRTYSDWFQPSCTFYYRPVDGPVTGQLVVRYQFR